MTETPASHAPANASRWKVRAAQVLKIFGVSSVMGAIAFWKTICVPLGLCPESFSTVLATALKPSDTRSRDIAAILPHIEKRENASEAFSTLTAFVRSARQRAANEPCNLTGARRLPADLQEAVKVLVAAADRADSTLQLDSLDLSGLALRGRRMNRPRFDGACLVAAVFDSASVRAGSFRGASLQRAWFRNAVLDSSDLSHAGLDSARFNEASLVGADLSNATARGASFFSASMSCVLLGNAELAGANFSLAHLQWAYLGGADVETAENLLQAASLRHSTFDGAEGLRPEVTRVLSDSGARLAAVSDLQFSALRLAQFAPDSVCHIKPRATRRP